MSKRLTTEQFIENARAVHGSKYDYSKVVYKNTKTEVFIICPNHGDFLQKPRDHLKAKKGIACQKCSYEHRAKLNSDTAKKFLQKAKIIHRDKYDYSKVVYETSKKKVLIICPVHGGFLQTPASHLQGKNCYACGRESAAKNGTLTQMQFIKKAIEVHGNKYDYSKAEYTATKDKIEIMCPVHGSFFQEARCHIYFGHGCLACGKLKQVSEPLFREALEKIFIDKFNKEYKFPNTRPNWLRNPETGYLLELDCYNEELELAFELHGTQHYEPIEFFGGEKSYIKQYRRDLRTRNMCRQKGVTLFAIDNRPVYGKGLSDKQKYYEQEILKCLRTVPEKIKIKLLEAKNNNK